MSLVCSKNSLIGFFKQFRVVDTTASVTVVPRSILTTFRPHRGERMFPDSLASAQAPALTISPTAYSSTAYVNSSGVSAYRTMHWQFGFSLTCCHHPRTMDREVITTFADVPRWKPAQVQLSSIAPIDTLLLVGTQLFQFETYTLGSLQHTSKQLYA